MEDQSYSNVAYSTYLSGSQVTDSQSHPSWRSRKGRYVGDLGGPFFTRKKSAEFNSEPMSLSGSDPQPGFARAWGYYLGPIFPCAPSLLQFPPNPETSDLSQLGATAMARCSPSRPSAPLSVFLAETIKEGIPHAIGGTLKAIRDATSGAERRKALGHAYLNVEFGWKPFIDDLLSIAKAVMRADELLAQFDRDSNKLVRRKYEFPPHREFSSVVLRNNVSPWTNPSSSLLTSGTVNQGQVIRSYELTRRQWFSGAFVYYIDPKEIKSLRGQIARPIQQARHLLGLSLTPDVIWNLAPWSWAFDWFSNTSEVLQNWTDWAIDSQVLAYGYMMEHSIATYRYTFVGPTGYRTVGPRPYDVVMTNEVKQRQQAHPYGFGMSDAALSLRQKAIVTALGLTKIK
ncbi:maturation protein [ssRNA phage Gerhypos.3_5]|uniref:Maturation protein n=2 Tax=Leviviricetes TaxID=2842243 RepID=A0A8S5L2G5_9VIRU|nr:maturation protein [ssRNA phage Gerhypos.3_5]QDH91087.1 MAG: hypothetical protein H3Bulk41322_000004 [Leviviridae sp.]DAD51816.1 TPA_asm: maturation protein [ssRNA phage Gerhypos.3_5]